MATSLQTRRGAQLFTSLQARDIIMVLSMIICVTILVALVCCTPAHEGSSINHQPQHTMASTHTTVTSAVVCMLVRWMRPNCGRYGVAGGTCMPTHMKQTHPLLCKKHFSKASPPSPHTPSMLVCHTIQASTQSQSHHLQNGCHRCPSFAGWTLDS